MVDPIYAEAHSLLRELAKIRNLSKDAELGGAFLYQLLANSWQAADPVYKKKNADVVPELAALYR